MTQELTDQALPSRSAKAVGSCLVAALALAAALLGCGAPAEDTSDAGPTPDGLSGWISVIEWNDTCDQWYLRTDWLGVVRAYFAEEFAFQRSLLHHTDFLEEATTSGSCTLYDSGLLPDGFDPSQDDAFDYVDFDCMELDNNPTGHNWCGPDQECTLTPGDVGHHDPFNDGGAHCDDLPRHADAGDIVISGLTAAITLEADEIDRYYPATAPPADLFDVDDTIKATASGDELAAFTLEAKGVAHLELGGNGVLDLANGNRTVSWTPSGSGARVQVAILTGAHDPNPIVGLILCDVADADGKVEIPQDVVDAVMKVGADYLVQKCSRVTRYNRSVTTHSGGEIELFVGSARNLRVSFPSPQ